VFELASILHAIDKKRQGDDLETIEFVHANLDAPDSKWMVPYAGWQTTEPLLAVAGRFGNTRHWPIDMKRWVSDDAERDAKFLYHTISA